MDEAGRGNARDEGTAYGRPRQHQNRLLTEIGPGTPCGEFMRRYWQPVGISAEVTARPKKVRILDEDLVLFRDRTGRAGLLYPRCMHRGTTLYYGKVEERGIRCCYHGWLFDVEGNCLEQPCEPEGGLHRDLARQPWYPVEERYGLVFAYLGPPAKKPVLPRYDNLEDLEPGERYSVVIGGFGSTGDDSFEIVPYSWLHMNDNVMDPYHVYVLHSVFTGPQFAENFKIMPKKVDFFPTESGVCYSAVRDLDDGRTVDRISSWLMPNIMSVPSIALAEGRSNGISWVVPVDDDKYFQVMVMRTREAGGRFALRINGTTWGEKSEAERQEWPGDFEAQFGQGPISLHSEEHLAQSDRGVAMQRRILEQQIAAVAEGRDPLGVAFDPQKALVHVRSGNFYTPSLAAE